MELRAIPREPLQQIMVARYYEAPLGRFLGVDPAEGVPRDPQSWNRYSYAGNNPLMFIDPTGTDPRNIFCMAGLCGGAGSLSPGATHGAEGSMNVMVHPPIDSGAGAAAAAGPADGGSEDPCADGSCSYVRVTARANEPSLGVGEFETVDFGSTFIGFGLPALGKGLLRAIFI